VADRVAQRAFLQVCGPQLEPARAEVSFAYQRGRSWVDALARAGQYRAQGLRWVFRTDIADFFDSVEHDLLRAVVRTQVPDPAMVELVDAWVQAPALTPKGLQARPRGLPEGAPLSPALANLYLREFDYQVDGRHGRLVRYADDLALFCRDLDAATAGAEHIAAELALLRLRLNPDKTYIATFDAGVLDAGLGRPGRTRLAGTGTTRVDPPAGDPAERRRVGWAVIGKPFHVAAPGVYSPGAAAGWWRSATVSYAPRPR